MREVWLHHVLWVRLVRENLVENERGLYYAGWNTSSYVLQHHVLRGMQQEQSLSLRRMLHIWVCMAETQEQKMLE